MKNHFSWKFLKKIKKKCQKKIFYLKRQLSGWLGTKFRLATVRTVGFDDFWNWIQEKSDFLRKNKIKRKNEDSVLWEVWRIMFSIFQTKNIHPCIFSELYFQILKTWNLDNCPDSVRTVAKTVVQKYSWCNVYTTTKCRLCHTSMF